MLWNRHLIGNDESFIQTCVCWTRFYNGWENQKEIRKISNIDLIAIIVTIFREHLAVHGDKFCCRWCMTAKTCSSCASFRFGWCCGDHFDENCKYFQETSFKTGGWYMWTSATYVAYADTYTGEHFLGCEVASVQIHDRFLIFYLMGQSRGSISSWIFATHDMRSHPIVTQSSRWPSF